MKVWLRVGKVLGTPQCLSRDSPLFWWNLNFQTLAVKNKLLALAFRALKELGFIYIYIYFCKGCGLSYCFASTFWNCCQISTTKIRQHFALFSWQKSSSILPLMLHSTQNTILTNLSLWEYNNKGAPLSQQKFGRVLHLVHYSALVRFCAYVYGARQYVHTKASQSSPKHWTCWCVSHTQENQCH